MFMCLDTACARNKSEAELRQMLQDPKYSQMNSDSNALPSQNSAKANGMDPERK